MTTNIIRIRGSVVILYRYSYSDNVGRHDQRNVNKNKAFKIKLAVTMASPEERQKKSYS